MKKFLLTVLAGMILLGCACGKAEYSSGSDHTKAVPVNTGSAGEPVAEFIGGPFRTAGEKVASGEATVLHYYHDNSFDTDIHLSQEICETAWKLLTGIRIGEQTGDPGICDANWFCLFTFRDGSTVAFNFVTDEYFFYNGQYYSVTDTTKAKALRRYLESMADQYSDEALKNAQIGLGMTELDRIDCTAAPVAVFDIDLDGDGETETLEFRLRNGEDEFADGLVCTCFNGGRSLDIGYFSAGEDMVRVFVAEHGQNERFAVIVNYKSAACDHMTEFVYMFDGQLRKKEFFDIFPAQFDPQTCEFLMTDGTVLTREILCEE